MPSPKIIAEGRGWVALLKPPHLPTTAPSVDTPCLTAWLRAQPHFAHRPFLHPTSRLDAPVSGLVLYALTSELNAQVLQARAEHRYRRLYLAALPADAPPFSGRCTLPIGVDKATPKRRRSDGFAPSLTSGSHRQAGPASGIAGLKPAQTLARPWLEDTCVRLHWLKPLTGRTHQLRVHAAEVSGPILGDALYGGRRRSHLPGGSVIQWPQVMLHCYSLDLMLPGGVAIRLRLPPEGPHWLCTDALSLGMRQLQQRRERASGARKEASSENRA